MCQTPSLLCISLHIVTNEWKPYIPVSKTMTETGQITCVLMDPVTSSTFYWLKIYQISSNLAFLFWACRRYEISGSTSSHIRMWAWRLAKRFWVLRKHYLRFVYFRYYYLYVTHCQFVNTKDGIWRCKVSARQERYVNGNLTPRFCLNQISDAITQLVTLLGKYILKHYSIHSTWNYYEFPLKSN
jgi:hypothetical protein